MPRLLGLETDSDKLRNLDFLRFVASVGIVYHHSHEFFVAPAARAQVIERTDGLALFVDLFFIISGFVMAYVYGGRVRSVRDYAGFLWKRVARLYPLHLAVLPLNIALWAILLTRGASDNAPSFAPDCIAAEALLGQAYYDCGGSPFNGVTWSISVEMGLYVALPVFALLSLRSPLMLALTGASAFGAVVALSPEYDQGPWLLRGVAGFAAGYLLFRLSDRLPSIPRADLAVLLLAAAALAAMLLGAPQPLIVLGLLLLAAVAISADRDARVHPAVDRLSPLGQLTYSIYIWHRLFILAFLNVVADKMFGGNDLVLVAMALVTFAAIAVVSYAGYFLIENPARRALNALVPRREAVRGRSHAP